MLELNGKVLASSNFISRINTRKEILNNTSKGSIITVPDIPNNPPKNPAMIPAIEVYNSLMY